MKYEKRGEGIQVDSGDEIVHMQIDPEAMAHIMSVLTNLYSNQILAVVREYSTNALDAHIEAGNEDPIEVFINSEHFQVRDFGMGMNADDIRNVYSRYGASTRRDSNDVVGMLGLGSKSALTYTNEFWVRGIKEGIETLIKVGLDSDGVGYMNIVMEQETDEIDGVEVTVPIKYGDEYKFLSEAKKFYSYWRTNPVLLNNESTERIQALRITDKIMRDIHASNYGDGHVVMGNVAYPVDNLPGGMIVWAEIGDVEIAPSREALQMSNKTQSFLNNARMEYNQNIGSALHTMVSNAETPQEAIEMAVLARKVHSTNGNYTWNGQAIPYNVKPIGEDEKFLVVPFDRSWRGRRKGVSEESYISLGTTISSTFIVGFDKKTLTPYNREKIEKWAERNHHTSSVVLAKEHPLPYFADPVKIIQWDDVRKIKTITQTVKKNPGAAKFKEVYIDGVYQGEVSRDEIPTDRPMFYTMKREDISLNQIGVTAGTPNFVLIEGLGRNQVKKFKRDFPHAQNAVDAFRVTAKAWFDSLTDEDYAQYYILSDLRYELEWLKIIDASKLLDPALVAVVNAAQGKTGKIDKEHSLYRQYGVLKNRKNACVMDNYPLYDAVNKHNTDHFILYANTLYTARKEGRIK